VFYFRPGHETYPIFYHDDILKILVNSVEWAAFTGNRDMKTIGTCPQITESLEEIHSG
jgi:trehalose utilization protein